MSSDKKIKPIISVKDLSAYFPNGNGGLQALDKLSFVVDQEEFICVLGPSGGGKSTLLRILAGLIPATSGEVTYNGERINEPNHDVGFVFQNANLMPWRTVIENIILPLELARIDRHRANQEAEEMVELVGLQGFENTLPRDLSGGMAQRVAIARALIHNPSTLLLDEPFGALDALTRERMGAELMRIWSAHKKTVVMVTHSISEAIYLSDRIIVLSSQPGTIRLDLSIDLARPRDESINYTTEFGELSRIVRANIGNS